VSGGVLIVWNDKEVLRVVDRELKEATKEGAEIVAASAQRRVPVKTGDLKRSIKVKESKFEDGGHIVGAQFKGDYKKYYASFVELGTFKDRAQPFLRPALHGSKRKIQKRFENRIK